MDNLLETQTMDATKFINLVKTVQIIQFNGHFPIISEYHTWDHFLLICKNNYHSETKQWHNFVYNIYNLTISYNNKIWTNKYPIKIINNYIEYEFVAIGYTIEFIEQNIINKLNKLIDDNNNETKPKRARSPMTTGEMMNNK